MIALIEQRMCTDDRKVWARYLESDGNEAPLSQLKAQAFKKLEATERLLWKNREYARAYNLQMVKMNQLKFATIG